MNTVEGLKFLQYCNDLKQLPRRGWVLRGVENPESVADHSWRVGMMSFLIVATDVDKIRCMKMGLVHDLAESIVGDITPVDNVAEEDKHDREARGFLEIVSHLPKEVAEEISGLWHEYEDQKTLESHYVYDFDKLDMLIQAKDYEYQQNKDLEEFFFNCQTLKTDMGNEYLKTLISQRKVNNQ
ncbi:hypothetical protein WA158_003160 [Blastocystis sp. Blastoise]